MPKYKEKDRSAILNSLRAGVVPAIGLQHVQVGRSMEVSEILKDLAVLVDGGSTVRFIVGDFGAGKSFFLSLCKLMAHEKRMIVMQADVTTEKILCASDGKARALVSELIKNMSCKSKPEGNALRFIIESWISDKFDLNSNPTPNDFQKALLPLSHLTLSQDFAAVLFRYFTAYKNQDSVTLDNCFKWLRAEYETKTEAREALGVRRIIDDADFFDIIKIYAGFARLAGYAATIVNVDELAVLIRQRTPMRHKNYETLLTIINDSLQGTNQGLAFLFGATSEAIENKEKGLFSYGALQTRLSESRFSSNGGGRDLSGPIIRLSPLTAEELYVLLCKLRDLYANGDENKVAVPDDGLKSFLTMSLTRLGGEKFVNPRETIKDFLSLLSLLEQNPGKKWQDYITTNEKDRPKLGVVGLNRVKIET